MLYHVDILSCDSADMGACGRVPHFVDKEPGTTRDSDLLGTQLAIGGVRARVNVSRHLVPPLARSPLRKSLKISMGQRLARRPHLSPGHSWTVLLSPFSSLWGRVTELGPGS